MDFYQNAIEKLGYKEITLWFKLSKKYLLWEMNHIDYGHMKENAPIPISEEQRQSWNGQKWSKRFSYGDATRIPVRVLR